MILGVTISVCHIITDSWVGHSLGAQLPTWGGQGAPSCLISMGNRTGGNCTGLISKVLPTRWHGKARAVRA